MEKTKFLMVVIVALLLLNMGTLAFLWFGHRPPHPTQGGKPEAATFLIQELRLDEGQKAQYDQLFWAHRGRMDSLKDKLNQNRQQFFNGLPVGDSTRVQAVLDNQRQLEMELFNHFRAVRTICRPEQQTQFEAVIQQVLKMSRHPDGPPIPHQSPPH